MNENCADENATIEEEQPMQLRVLPKRVDNYVALRMRRFYNTRVLTITQIRSILNFNSERLLSSLQEGFSYLGRRNWLGDMTK